jgi:hypothetical protein
VVSVLVHAALFLLAGMLVVFTVVKQKEVEFVPPQAVERTKMKLKKPKDNVKKSSRPKSTTRITTTRRSSMPKIDFPEMDGLGDGLMDGLDGMDMMPDFGGEQTAYGSVFTAGNDLQGHFYDFKRDRMGKEKPMNPDQLTEVIYQYIKSGWKHSLLAPYYRSPKTLYSTTICIPTVLSEMAPWAFGEFNTVGYCWAVLYEGELVYPEDITFRFWGVGDKFMSVYVGGETVLFCAYRNSTRSRFSDIWDTTDPQDNTYYFAEHRARPSSWITLKANEPKDINVLMGDLDGGLVYHILSVEVQGESYPNTRGGGGPTYPVFRTSEIPVDILDVIYTDLYSGDTTLTNGPVFRDFAARQPSAAAPAGGAVPPEPSVPPEPQMREWTCRDGAVVSGRFQHVLGNTLVLETERRRPVKLQLDQLIDEDRERVDLLNPPDFDINWTKKSRQVPNPPLSPYISQRPLSIYDYNFGVRIRQATRANAYDHEVQVEYFAVGEEIAGDNLILLDHRQEVFNPAGLAGEAFELLGPDIRMKRMAYRDSAPMRGTEYFGFLVTLRDKQGYLIAHKASHDFLLEILPGLSRLVPHNHFNRDGQRVFPTQPTEDNRGFGATTGN